MKTLKPKEGVSSTIIPNDIFKKVEEELESLKGTIARVNARIEELQDELNSDTLTKEAVFCDALSTQEVSTTTLDTSSIVAHTGDIGKVTSSEIEAGYINTQSMTGGTIVASNGQFGTIAAQNGTISNLSSPEARITTITSDNGTITNLNAHSLSVDGTMSLANAEVASLDTLNSLTAANATLGEATAQSLNAASLTSTDSDSTSLRATLLENGYKVWDKRNMQPVSTQNNEPFFIKLPHITSGTYRVVFVENDVITASVVVIDSGKAPIVTYTRVNDALTAFHYDGRNIWLESYCMNGELYWSSDDYDSFVAPEHEAMLPANEYTTYTTTAEQRVVVLGDNSAYYGLDVLGSLKASIFVDSSKDGAPLFYTGTSLGLLSKLEAYLPDDGSISIAGYVYDPETNVSYSLQTITRSTDEETGAAHYDAFVETANGTGTDTFTIAPGDGYTYGLFTTTYDWDRNING